MGSGGIQGEVVDKFDVGQVCCPNQNTMLFLLGITFEGILMAIVTSVTSKGQVTIPLKLRQQLGIRAGSKVVFEWVRDHLEIKVKSTPVDVPSSGFGLLKSKRKAVPADFDPASLLQK